MVSHVDLLYPHHCPSFLRTRGIQYYVLFRNMVRMVCMVVLFNFPLLLGQNKYIDAIFIDMKEE